jgi:hypothetical protein
MPNKKISEFPITTTLASGDDFLINHLGTTSTVSFSTVSDTISQTVSSSIINSLTGDTVVQKLSANFIKNPDSATNGQVLTYNGSTSTWVASSLSAQGYNNSLTENGYQKLPSGLIMQWGKYAGSLDDTNTTITLSIAFPNAFLNVTATPYRNSDVGGGNVVSVHTNITTSLNSFTLYGCGIGDVPQGYFWQAIGF